MIYTIRYHECHELLISILQRYFSEGGGQKIATWNTTTDSLRTAGKGH